ncbi:MAG: ImmA/IrrE family metallo-endopeptidase [Pseudomonadota bacterium]
MSKTADLLRSLQLSDLEIAERTGISAARISELLGGHSATLSELRKISNGLRISLQSIAKKAEIDAHEEAIQLLFRRVGSLNEHFDPTREAVSTFVIAALDVLPPRDANPEWIRGLEPKEESYAEAEALANEVRARIYPENLYEPVPDLSLVLGSRGEIIVSRLNQSRFEGASLIIGGHPFIFVSPRFSGRMLFTLAHELGHVIAHHQSGNGAIFEKASEIGGWRQRKREAFVDAFASVFLMPAHGVGVMLKKVREHLEVKREAVGDIEILILARYYGVSFDVAARRCEILELLPPGGARSLSDNLNKEHGSAEKRAELAGLPPRVNVPLPQISNNLYKAACEAVKNEKNSIGWIADNFGVSINDIFAAKKKLDYEYTH